MKCRLAYVLFLLSLVGWAQDIPLHTWRTHFSYADARIIEQAENTIFCAVANGLFSVDLLSNSVQKLTKVNGLGDVSITAMHYSGQVFVIGYESGAIDLIDSSGLITTITTLRDAQIVADKAIHSISSIDEKVYLATDFGIIWLDIALGDVRENYRNIGNVGAELPVKEILVQNDSIYILSADGIRSGTLSSNLLDFNAWTFFSETATGSFEHLTSSNDNLYVVKDQVQLWKFDGIRWFDTGLVFPDSVRALSDQNGLLTLTSSGIYSVFPNPVELITDGLLTSGNDLIFNGNSYWIADGKNGLLQIGRTTEQILPDGLLHDAPTKIKRANGVTYAFYGPAPAQYDGTSDGLGYSVFEEGKWIQREIPDFYNLTDVAAIGGNLYFTSLGFGLYDEQQDLILNADNATFGVSNNFSHVQLSAIQRFDNSIWILSYNSDNALYQLMVDGSIRTFFSSKVKTRFPLDMDLSSEGVLWIRRGAAEGGGISTFDPTLDLQRTILMSDNLPSSSVSGIAIETDDKVWISTSSGVANFDAASLPFGDLDVTIPIFENGFLFKDERINDVFTDGGDRIWFATEAGVWVLTRDLTTVVNQFTKDNSPLPSDRVMQLSYDKKNGEVFILTDKGLVSYRSASSAAEDVHESTIGIFPNPVPPSYLGTVGFSGLARNANIKITDTRGRLVQELQANGGMTSWDLRNFNQGRVSAGIYLIFSSSSDGIETLVGKIAVIK